MKKRPLTEAASKRYLNTIDSTTSQARHDQTAWPRPSPRTRWPAQLLLPTGNPHGRPLWLATPERAYGRFGSAGGAPNDPSRTDAGSYYLHDPNVSSGF